MKIFFDYLWNNKEWLFSGAGIIVLTFIVSLIFKLFKKTPRVITDTDKQLIDKKKVSSPSIDIDLVRATTGEIITYKVPSNVSISCVLQEISEDQSLDVPSAENAIVELLLVDEKTKKPLDNTKTLTELGYTQQKKTSKNKKPRFYIKSHAKYKCFPTSTKVLLADSVGKDIERVKKGDRVLTFNFALNRLETGIVIDVLDGYADNIIEVNKIITASSKQTVFTQNSVKEFGELNLGDELFIYPILSGIKIYSVENINKRIKVFNLIVHPNNNFFANNILVEDQIGVPLVNQFYNSTIANI